jgi:hypothetical protein
MALSPEPPMSMARVMTDFLSVDAAGAGVAALGGLAVIRNELY